MKGGANVWLNRMTILLSWIGVLIAGRLTVSHMGDGGGACLVGGGGACGALAEHSSSSWGGVPVAAFGLAAYVALAFLSMARNSFMVQRYEQLTKVATGFAGAGVVLSGWLMFQMFTQVAPEIGAPCVDCIASAATMTLLFLAHLPLVRAKLDGAMEADGLALIGGGIAGTVAIVAVLMQPGSLLSFPDGGEVVALGERSVEDILPDEEKIFGPADAPITILEFADFICPSCRVQGPRLKALARQHPDQIRFAYRHFPLYRNAGWGNTATLSAAAEFAADHGKFFEYVEAVWDPSLNQAVRSRDTTLLLLERLGLDSEEFERLMDQEDSELVARVAEDMSLGVDLGVGATPTFFVITNDGQVRKMNTNELEAWLSSPEVEAVLRGEEA